MLTKRYLIRLSSLVGALTVGLLSVACSDDDTAGAASGAGASSASGGASGAELVPIEVSSFCDRLANTCGAGITVEECIQNYTPMRVTSECVDAMASATCEDLLADESVSGNICFPSCSVEENTCNDDGTITRCFPAGGSLHAFVMDCADVCASTDVAPAWTGVCGKTYGQQTSELDKCWCE